jgi:cytochrome c oxidase cbb3-type subunit I/II
LHGGALGWNGFLTFGMIYYLVPKLWKVEIYSKKLTEWHFWISFVGIVIYYTAMWAAGITQGLMWRAVNADGRLTHPDFVETVTRIVPLYWFRAIGGLLFIVGFLIMLYNLYKTVAPAKPVVDTESVNTQNVMHEAGTGHRRFEGLATVFTVFVLIAVLIGSVIEIYPALSIHKYVDAGTEIKPWSPLEQAGRDIYVKEGCYVCHSQMIRKLSWEVQRFGPASTVAESMYDRPFQWGSKRTGPDLARVGGKYPNMWHYRHMLNPRDLVADSIMPNYPWLETKKIDFNILRRKFSVLKRLGTPYDDATVANADKLAEEAAAVIADDLEKNGAPAGLKDKQIVALIAYLQALGQKGVK